MWAIVELMGHGVIAGEVSKVEPFGSPMLQVDVPSVGDQPGFSKLFNPSAIYSIVYVEEGIARSAAQEAQHKPIKLFLPEVEGMEELRAENRLLQRQLNQKRIPVYDSSAGYEYYPTDDEE